MVHVDVPRVKGKMAEREFSITSLANALGISRNTLSNYLDCPEKIPYSVISDMANLLCDTPEEAICIFFATGLRKT